MHERNFLPLNIRELNSLKTFTNAITSGDNISNAKKPPPPYFSFGDGIQNPIHTKLRRNCMLKCDLFKYNICSMNSVIIVTKITQ